MAKVEEADNPGSLGHPQLCRRRCTRADEVRLAVLPVHVLYWHFEVHVRLSN